MSGCPSEVIQKKHRLFGCQVDWHLEKTHTLPWWYVSVIASVSGTELDQWALSVPAAQAALSAGQTRASRALSWCEAGWKGQQPPSSWTTSLHIRLTPVSSGDGVCIAFLKSWQPRELCCHESNAVAVTMSYNVQGHAQKDPGASAFQNSVFLGTASFTREGWQF